MPTAYVMEFRRDVAQVLTLSTWSKKANIDGVLKPGIAAAESVKLREPNNHVRLLEHEAVALRGTLAYMP